MAFLTRILSRPDVSIVLRKIIELNFRKQKTLIKEYLLPISTGDRIIDIGCGTGEFSSNFPAENYTGIDIDAANIEYARAHFKKDFRVADATRLPYDDDVFTHVLVVGVLHHMDDDIARAALREITRILKPGGRALIMEDTRSRRLLTLLLHHMDLGAHIRTTDAWNTMIKQYFFIENQFTFYNSICHYSVFILKKTEYDHARP